MKDECKTGKTKNNQKRRIAANTLYTMGGMILMNGILQLIVYPLLNKQVGEEELGGLLYIMGIVGIVCPSVGQALNTSRLVVRRDHTVSNGDYNLLILICGGITSIVSLILCRGSMTGMGMTACVFVLLMVTTFRYYGDVEYRLNLNYRRYFIYYALISAGYLAGFGLFKLTGNWIVIFFLGEAAAFLFLLLTGSVYRNFLKRSSAFSVAAQRGIFLMISYFVTNTTLNIDRIVLKHIMGNEAVTEFYVVSLVGKTMVLLVAPINTIIISYLTKSKKLLTRNEFLKLTLAGGAVTAIFFGLCQIGTPLFVWLFYRNLYATVQPFMTIANLAQVLGLYSAYLFILVLTFTTEKWQMILQALHFGVLAVSSVLATQHYGMMGFSLALLGSNLFRVAAVILFGTRKAGRPDYRGGGKTANTRIGD